eukprot:TRINITY_DN16318_c0_g1_i1.p1 TRINITY_DN16318_c0_g1~~TRINITY_DN16318_c0_g1_i1.p1  ORF type:complete len:402 (+),score=77.56 TRINITY_DN16318_c0_g1_i1:32-1207(+)
MTSPSLLCGFCGVAKPELGCLDCKARLCKPCSDGLHCKRAFDAHSVVPYVCENVMRLKNDAAGMLRIGVDGGSPVNFFDVVIEGATRSKAEYVDSVRKWEFPGSAGHPDPDKVQEGLEEKIRLCEELASFLKERYRQPLSDITESNASTKSIPVGKTCRYELLNPLLKILDTKDTEPTDIEIGESIRVLKILKEVVGGKDVVNDVVVRPPRWGCRVGFIRFLDTYILSDVQERRVVERLLPKEFLKATLVYSKARKDKRVAETFHDSVGDRQHTLVLIRTTLGDAFGGYTGPTSWSSGGKPSYYCESPTAFLFTCPTDEPILVPIKPTKTKFAIVGARHYGPTFGGGHDLYVDKKLKSGVCRGMHSYRGSLLPEGRVTFDVMDLEVFCLER